WQSTLIIVGGLKAKESTVATTALAELSTTRSGPARKARVESLESMLRDPDPRTQSLAAIGLVQLTGRIDTYLPYLTRGAESEDSFIRTWCSVYAHLNRGAPRGAGTPFDPRLTGAAFAPSRRPAGGASVTPHAAHRMGPEWLWMITVLGLLGVVGVVIYSSIDFHRRRGGW